MMKEFRESDDPFYNLEYAASATECTGLMPRSENEEEAEQSAKMYSDFSIRCMKMVES